MPPAPGARQHRLKSAADPGPCRGRRIRTIRPFYKSAHGRQLVGHFVQMPPAFSKKIRGHLASEQQDRLVASECRQKPGARVQHAGARNHRECRRPSRRAGIAECHIGASLFVPRADDLDAGLRPMERVEQAIGLGTRKPENRVDAVILETGHKRFTAVHLGHSELRRHMRNWSQGPNNSAADPHNYLIC